MKRVFLGVAFIIFFFSCQSLAAFVDFRNPPFDTCTTSPATSCTRTVGGIQVTIEGWHDADSSGTLNPFVDTPANLWWDNLDGFGVESNVGYEPDEIDGPEFLVARFDSTQILSLLSFTDLFYEGPAGSEYLETGFYMLTIGGVDGPLVQFFADPTQVPGSTNGVLDLLVSDENVDYLTFTAPGQVGGENHEFSLAGLDVQTANTDLSIIKTDSPDPVVVGNNVTYSITVTNNGPDNATGVTVTDTLDPSVTFVSATPSQGSCSEAGGTVTCNLGSIANGANVTISIVVTANSVGTISNTASVSGNESDPNAGNNNTGAVNTTVDPPPPVDTDLSITKTDSPDPVFLGQGDITYTITVTNGGPSNATGVTVTDTLPAGVTFVSANASQGTGCSEVSGTVTCDLGNLANGANATVTIVVTPTAQGTLTNTASVSGNEGDPNVGNNSVSEDTTVGFDCAGQIGTGMLISDGLGSQQTQTVTYNPVDDEYLVLWHDQNGSVNDIRGARLDKDGTVIVTNIPIAIDSERQAGPWVAYGGVGVNRGYLAVWVQGRTVEATGTNVYGAWILPDGTVSSIFQIEGKVNDQRSASVWYDPGNDQFLVTWIDINASYTDRDIWRAILAPGGSVIQSPAPIVNLVGSEQRGPYPKYDHDNGRFLLVWFDDRNGDFDIFGSPLDTTGIPLVSGGSPIVVAPDNQRNPRFHERRATDGIGNFVMAWIDFRNAIVDPVTLVRKPDIWGALVDENGGLVGSAFAVSEGPSEQRAASVDADYVRTKVAVVTWIDNRDTAPPAFDIWCRGVTQTGQLSAEIKVTQQSSPQDDTRGPLVFYTADGAGADNGFLQLWRGNGAVDTDLFGRKVFP